MSEVALKELVDYYAVAEYGGKVNPLIGNDTAKLTFPLMYFLSNVNCLIRGPAGSGKTTLLDGAIALYAGEEAFADDVEDLIVASAGSAKSLLTDTMAKRLEQAPYFAIRELQPWLQDGATNIEVIKVWMENKPFNYQVNDVTTRSTRNLILPAPTVVSTIADENEKSTKLGAELLRRFFIIEMHSSVDLNRRIHRIKAENDALLSSMRPQYGESQVWELREHLKGCVAKKYGEKRKQVYLDKDHPGNHGIKDFINPASVAVQSKIPVRSTRSNSMINYWFLAPRAVATYRHPVWQGMWGDVMMVTVEDNFHAWQMCGQSIVHSSMGINGTLGATLLDLLPSKSVMDEEYGWSSTEGAHIDDIVRRMRLESDVSKSVVVANLSNLEMNGYVYSSDNGKEYWRHHAQEYDIGQSWPQIVEETKLWVQDKYPHLYDDYLPTLEDPRAQFWVQPNGDIVWEEVAILDVETYVRKVDNAAMEDNKAKMADLESLDAYL